MSPNERNMWIALICAWLTITMALYHQNAVRVEYYGRNQQTGD